MKKPHTHMREPHRLLQQVRSTHLVHNPLLDMSHTDTQEVIKEHGQLGNNWRGLEEHWNGLAAELYAVLPLVGLRMP